MCRIGTNESVTHWAASESFLAVGPIGTNFYRRPLRAVKCKPEKRIASHSIESIFIFFLFFFFIFFFLLHENSIRLRTLAWWYTPKSVRSRVAQLHRWSRRIQDPYMIFFCHFVACIILLCAKFLNDLPSLVEDTFTENNEHYTISIYFPCKFDSV